MTRKFDVVFNDPVQGNSLHVNTYTESGWQADGFALAQGRNNIFGTLYLKAVGSNFGYETAGAWIAVNVYISY